MLSYNSQLVTGATAIKKNNKTILKMRILCIPSVLNGSKINILIEKETNTACLSRNPEHGYNRYNTDEKRP
jgi:hypothetical protein